jgi:hypothetical protein
MAVDSKRTTMEERDSNGSIEGMHEVGHQSEERSSVAADVAERKSVRHSADAPEVVIQYEDDEVPADDEIMGSDDPHALTVGVPKRASSVYSEDAQESEERQAAILDNSEDHAGGVDVTAETKPRAEEELHERSDSEPETVENQPEMDQITKVGDVVAAEASRFEAEHTPDEVEVNAEELVPADTVYAPTSAPENSDTEQPTLDTTTYTPTVSPEPTTLTAPVSPLTPQESRMSTGSLASIDLSDTDQDYDQYSAEQMQEFLATPRASSARYSAHMRKPSSLEILQNTWAPPLVRQSTLFDITKTTPPQTPAELEARQSMGMGARQSVHFQEPEQINSRASSIAPSVSLSKPGSMRSVSLGRSSSSDEELQVDWSQLERNEQQEKTDKDLAEGAEDESTAFLLARLEQENALLTSNPKAATNWDKDNHSKRLRSQSRPPSIAHLKKLVGNSHDTMSVRYSVVGMGMLPTIEEPPPMTELEFWAALVQDYPSTATRLPTLTTSKIRSGIPPPLRGVVWQSISGARDRHLESSFDRLVGESSPYEGIINKDVGRSFPGVELFRDAEGEGQKMLGRVLKCFSLYSVDIGYCQGLGFLVGPLLMNMGEREAFCVLVR